jgi:hypothetical protein
LTRIYVVFMIILNCYNTHGMRLILILCACGRIRNIPPPAIRRSTLGCDLDDRNSRHARAVQLLISLAFVVTITYK